MYEIKKLELVDKPETRDWPRLPCRYFDLCGGTSTGGYVLGGKNKYIFEANNLASLIAILLFRLASSRISSISTQLIFARGSIHLQPSQTTSSLRLKYSSLENLARRARSGKPYSQKHGSKRSHSKKRSGESSRKDCHSKRRK